MQSGLSLVTFAAVWRLAELGDSEVQDFHLGRRGDHDISRLNVSMDNTGGMCRCQCGSRLAGTVHEHIHRRRFSVAHLL